MDPVLAGSTLPCSEAAGPQPGGEGTASLGVPLGSWLVPCSHYSLTQVFQPHHASVSFFRFKLQFSIEELPQTIPKLNPSIRQRQSCLD